MWGIIIHHTPFVTCFANYFGRESQVACEGDDLILYELLTHTWL